jgi:hypothetical protein
MRLITSGFCFSILFAFYALCDQSDVKYYITPTRGNLAVLHSSHEVGGVLHATTSEISGGINISSVGASMSFEMDLGRLTAEERSLGSFFGNWFSNPRAYFHFPELAGWPKDSLPHDTLLDLTGSGTLMLNGVTQNIQMPMRMNYSQSDPERLESAKIYISGGFILHPTDFGIDEFPKRLVELMADINVEFYLFAYPVPYRASSTAYIRMHQDSYYIAGKYKYPEINEAHLLLTALEAAYTKKVLKRMGISSDQLYEMIVERLETDSPGESNRNIPMNSTASQLHRWESHREAYSLGSAKVEPIHYILALLKLPDDHWIKDALSEKGVTYNSLRDFLKGKSRLAEEVILLGNPFKPESVEIPMRYARNVWDMQLWDGRIYLGHGNSSNMGPARNAGPIPVISYDPKTGSFETEFTVDEEQIDRYRVIFDQLHIPGHDPRDPWELGNFYRLASDGWEKIRTIPIGIHAYDVLEFEDSIFAALGTIRGAIVSRSDDNGQTWTSFILPESSRTYELFALGDELYASAYDRAVYRYTSDGFRLIHADLFPGAKPGNNPLVVRSTNFEDQLLYIGADNVNDHQWSPFGIYKASRIDEATPLELPSTDLPYDILVRDEEVYILTNRTNPATPDFTVVIYGSYDLDNWTEVVRFNMPTFARSFEYYDGAFYVGLGTSTDSLNQACGNIYKVILPSE